MAADASDGGLHPRPFVRSASSAAAGPAAFRTRRQARARLSQLDAQPAQIPQARCARCTGIGHAGADAGSHRGHRRSGQSGARSRVCAWRGPGWKASARRTGSRSSPAITTPMFAPPGIALPRHGATISPAIDAPDQRRGISGRAPPRPARTDRRVLGGPDAAASWRRGGSDAASWTRLRGILAQVSAEQAFRVLLDPSPAAFGARAKRLTDSSELLAAAEAAWRGAGAAWARSRSFHDLDRRAEGIDPGDRRAVGLGARAWPLSGGGL